MALEWQDTGETGPQGPKGDPGDDATYTLPQATSTTLGGVKLASNQDFCAYMGIVYNAADWV